jgi:hypothetical protein
MEVGKETNWDGFYAWCDKWLAYPTTWAIIPDVIDGGSQLQDAMIREWPHGDRGAPVWHMDEPLNRLLQLTEKWPKVCIGSTAEYAVVLSAGWERRMDEVFNEVSKRHSRLPWLHMLRGMQCLGLRWPFASVDSTDIAQNHNRPQNTPEAWLTAGTPSSARPRGNCDLSKWSWHDNDISLRPDQRLHR